MVARRVRVTGRVQGVGFRAWTAGRAGALGLSGWVRNEADGSVTALLAGPQERVAAMIAALREGPRFALVREVEVAAADPPEERGFRILR